MSDLTSFQLRFSKEGMGHIVQNRPGSDLDGLVRVWPNASIWKQSGVQESSGLIFVAGRKPVHYQLPTFRLSSVLPQASWIRLCRTSPDPILFWQIVSGFGQTDPVQKEPGVQESSGPLLANASQPIRTGCESDPACLLGVVLSKILNVWFR